MRPNKILLTALTCISTLCAVAQQNFRYKATVPAVDSSGFYQIALSADMLAKCNIDLSDIRLINQQKKYIPFIYGGLLQNKSSSSFIPFNILSAKQQDSLTALIIENQPGIAINQLNLIIQNTQAERLYSLSGSDDLVNWYAIKENLRLQGTPNSNPKPLYEQAVNFPASNYRYFKFTVNNKRNEPVKITQVGIYKHQTNQPSYTLLKGTSFIQKDSAGVTRIHVFLKDAYPINKLQLAVTGARFYKRNISIYAKHGKQRQWLTDTVLSSAGVNNFYVTAKTNQIEIEITNGDNPPLKIEALSVAYINQSIVAQLNKADRYEILLGDNSAKSPDYDLVFFADSLSRNLKLLNTGPLVKNKTFVAEHITEKSFPAWLLWLAIILVLAILGILTYKMTKEISKKENHQD